MEALLAALPPFFAGALARYIFGLGGEGDFIIYLSSRRPGGRKGPFAKKHGFRSLTLRGCPHPVDLFSRYIFGLGGEGFGEGNLRGGFINIARLHCVQDERP